MKITCIDNNSSFCFEKSKVTIYNKQTSERCSGHLLPRVWQEWNSSVMWYLEMFVERETGQDNDIRFLTTFCHGLCVCQHTKCHILLEKAGYGEVWSPTPVGKRLDVDYNCMFNASITWDTVIQIHTNMYVILGYTMSHTHDMYVM